MGGLHRAIAEVFLHTEHVYPALGQRHPNAHIFTRDLTHLPADVSRNENICANINLPRTVKKLLNSLCASVARMNQKRHWAGCCKVIGEVSVQTKLESVATDELRYYERARSASEFSVVYWKNLSMSGPARPDPTRPDPTTLFTSLYICNRWAD